MIQDSPSKKFVSMVLPVVGAVFVLLGLLGAFTFTGCGPGALTCVRVYSLDILTVVAGTIAVVVGIRLNRGRSGSR